MNDYIERLTNELLNSNNMLSYAQARTWIELLWEDFEATYAKAGHKYRGKEMTERVVLQWVQNYGNRLDQFVTSNPKFKNLLNSDDHLKH